MRVSEQQEREGGEAGRKGAADCIMYKQSNTLSTCEAGTVLYIDWVFLSRLGKLRVDQRRVGFRDGGGA